jgi:hypothetical protein
MAGWRGDYWTARAWRRNKAVESDCGLPGQTILFVTYDIDEAIQRGSGLDHRSALQKS